MTNEHDLKNSFDVRRMADPAGTGLRGVAPGYDLTKGALGHPQILWMRKGGQDVLMEADVYAQPGQPMCIYINCPICMMEGRTVQLRITQDRKQFQYEVGKAPPAFPGWTTDRMNAELAPLVGFPASAQGLGGTLTIEESIRCTFEAEPTLRRSVDPLCPWRVRIVNNVARNV